MTPTTTATIIGAFTEVFREISTWAVSAISSVTAVFWVDGALTFLGVLAVVALAISIFFLLMGLIQNFLHLRG